MGSDKGRQGRLRDKGVETGRTRLKDFDAKKRGRLKPISEPQVAISLT